MARPLIMMATCVLVAFALPRLIYGRPAVDHSGGSVSNMLLVHNSKPEDFPVHERKETIVTSLVRRDASIPVKSRQRRQSDQILAEWETLMTLLRMSSMLSQAALSQQKGVKYRYHLAN